MVANSKKDINQINLDNHRSLILIPLWWLWAAPGLHTITSSTLSLFNEHISTKGVISFTECRKEGIWDRWDRRAEIPRELILVNVMQNGPLYIKGALYVSHKELTHQKRPWCWGRLKAGGQGDDRKWDGWMASPTWWTWICASSRNWWWSGKPGVLQSMGSQRVGHNWVTELNWTYVPQKKFGICPLPLWSDLLNVISDRSLPGDPGSIERKKCDLRWSYTQDMVNKSVALWYVKEPQ